MKSHKYGENVAMQNTFLLSEKAYKISIFPMVTVCGICLHI